MTKELLLTLITAQKHLELFALALSTFFTIGISFCMGMVILKSKAVTWRSCSMIILIFLYFFITKWFSPNPVSPIVHLLLLGGALFLNCKANFIQAVGAGFSSILAVSTGDIIIGIAVKIFSGSAQFLTKTAYGIILTQLIGWVAPLVVIYVLCYKRKESVFIELRNKELVYSFMIYVAAFYQIYNAIMDYYMSNLKTNQFVTMIISTITFIGGYLALRYELKKRHKDEIDEVKQHHESQVDAITEDYENMKRYGQAKKTDIKKLVEKELAGYLYRNASSYSLASGILDDVKRNM